MTPPDVSAPEVVPDTASAREVFLAWEKLRIVYNGVLVAVVLGASALGALQGHARWSDVAFRRHLLFAAVVANVLYCTGPVAEGYLALLGSPRRAARGVLFGLGLLFASGLAFVDVSVWRVFDV